MTKVLNAFVSIPQAVWIACNFSKESPPRRLTSVSIPQAVWIACNAEKWEDLLCGDYVLFQYRKRYGLHAI